MKLVIDFGNTLKKIAIFDKNIMVDLAIFQDLSLNDLINFLGKYQQVDTSILSSVIQYPEEIKNYLNNKTCFIELTGQTPLPITIKYNTPDTLGRDRIAAAVAGCFLYPDKNVLVINAGTCITYDLITTGKEYLGGSISPGINLRYKALHNFTGMLPLIEKTDDPHLIGQSTKDSIVSGVQLGALAEMEDFINQYRKIYGDLTIILSGGDANYFDKKLKNNIFAVPNIVLSGLKIILDFNAQL
jgi:type III pantothenate kinase